eukprot:3325543-Pyramimonas_sp.AAC.1
MGPVFWGGLEFSWAPLRHSSGRFGPSWSRPGGLLGGVGAIFGASSAVLERWKHEMVRKAIALPRNPHT